MQKMTIFAVENDCIYLFIFKKKQYKDLLNNIIVIFAKEE